MPVNFNTTIPSSYEVTTLQMFEDIGTLCFSVMVIGWIMVHALDCCINPFTDKLIVQLKECQTELDNSDAVICSYEEEIDALKNKLHTMKIKYENCYKAAQDLLEHCIDEDDANEPKTKRPRSD